MSVLVAQVRAMLAEQRKRRRRLPVEAIVAVGGLLGSASSAGGPTNPPPDPPDPPDPPVPPTDPKAGGGGLFTVAQVVAHAVGSPPSVKERVVKMRSVAPLEPPVPIAETYIISGTGTITFDRPLDTSVPLTPGDFARQVGANRRTVTAIDYASATVLEVTGAAAAVPTAGDPGWYYTATGARLRGVDGAPVADFAAFDV